MKFLWAERGTGRPERESESGQLGDTSPRTGAGAWAQGRPPLTDAQLADDEREPVSRASREAKEQADFQAESRNSLGVGDVDERAVAESGVQVAELHGVDCDRGEGTRQAKPEPPAPTTKATNVASLNSCETTAVAGDTSSRTDGKAADWSGEEPTGTAKPTRAGMEAVTDKGSECRIHVVSTEDASGPSEMEAEGECGNSADQDHDGIVTSDTVSPRETTKRKAERRPHKRRQAAEPVEAPSEVATQSPADSLRGAAKDGEGVAGAGSGLFPTADASERKLEADSVLRDPAAAANEEGQQWRTPQYRAPARARPPGPERSRARDPRQEPTKSTTGDKRASIYVRVIFQQGGYCCVSLLLRRLPGLPERLVVSSEDGDVELLAIDDEWYQNVGSVDFARLLSHGIVCEDSDTDQRWVLAGREIFVLAPNTTHRGFISCPRLSVGRTHVVLCSTAQLAQVESALRAAGCAEWDQFGEEDGVPPGWRILRGVTPRQSVNLSAESDILNILRPLPEVEIELEGGIRLVHNRWLLGYPPTIRVYGDPEHTERVRIDGRKATVSGSGGYIAPEWDREGDHQIWCGDTNRSYSLVRSEANWTYWPAYSFVPNRSDGSAPEFEFCGPLVLPVAKDERSNEQPVVQVPPTNPVLLGACPGDVFVARQRRNLRGAHWLGLAPFAPVWALPTQPLHCDKRLSRVLLLTELAPLHRVPTEKIANERQNLERWIQLILDASRKGLAVEPARRVTDDLWREYRQLARNLWRSSR